MQPSTKSLGMGREPTIGPILAEYLGALPEYDGALGAVPITGQDAAGRCGCRYWTLVMSQRGVSRTLKAHRHWIEQGRGRGRWANLPSPERRTLQA
jgi:hypothetical protein